jgi:asparagine synthase (glutamine-hydrolysing)
MCGISGIINLNNTPVDYEVLKKMNDIVHHRGPDDEGFFIHKNVGLGHRRLAIIDLSASGNQPMHYLDRYTIVYNGEIYNFLELKKQLIARGYIFKSKSDTEVILAAYDCWQETCVNYFNGMWAFAIFDKKEHKLFCSRDRFGVKPFYYVFQNQEFYFASEIKQFLACKYIKKLPNQAVMLQFLILNSCELTEETFFESIYKLPASHNLTLDLKSGKHIIKRYYEIELKPNYQNLNFDDALENFTALFEDSVRLRLISDVKVGTCLSGGLDSSSIAAFAANIYNKDTGKFSAITAKTEGKFDESDYAKKVVDYHNLDWHISNEDKNKFASEIDKILYFQEEPIVTPSVFLQYNVMKLARKSNIPVLLDGQGGDETLLGYAKYIPASIKGVSVKNQISAIFQLKKNYNLSYKYLLLNQLYFSNFRIRQQKLLHFAHYIGLNKKLINDIDWTYIKEYAASNNNLFSLQKLEIEHTTLPSLLRYEDKNSMAHSVETRLPFLDYRLLEFNLSINSNHKIQKGYSKFILRKSVENSLPDDIVWRKNKFSFNISDDTWSYSSNIDKVISESVLFKEMNLKNLNSLPKNAFSRWRLYSLANWHRIFIENDGDYPLF